MIAFFIFGFHFLEFHGLAGSTASGSSRLPVSLFAAFSIQFARDGGHRRKVQSATAPAAGRRRSAPEQRR
jgi:hypothetical protein